MALLVQDEVGDPELAAVAVTVHPPQDGPDPDDELLDAERLGHVVVAAQGEAPQLVVQGVSGGEEEHRQPAPDPVPADALEHFEAVQIGQHHVEHEQVGPKRGNGLERLAPEVGHLHLEALVAQGHREQIGDAVLVVDDEDP